MGDIQEMEIESSVVLIPREASTPHHAAAIKEATTNPPKHRQWWIRMVLYTLCVLFAQSAATLLGRFYYTKGGKSIWLPTLAETLGFPILIPFSLYLSPTNVSSEWNNKPKEAVSPLICGIVYVFLGLLHAADNMLYSIGLLNLPVSTFALISSTQLAFNAFFSHFLNKQKLTPLILNSIVLLTISSTLLVLQSDSENPNSISKRKYIIGFSCTVMASSLYSLMLSITQIFIHRVLKRENFHVVLNLIIYQSLVATCVSFVALVVSKEWNSLGGELDEFEPGKVSYVMVLIGIIVAWQMYSIGAVGLIFEVSSFFSIVISTLGLPIVPILAVVFFHDRMDGVKVVSMLLALWGFASYVYQHYLDSSQS